jgi:FkbH-like protein
LVSEDGPNAVTAAPEGKGYRHFIYQTLLQRLRARGILLALISRNDEQPVRAALEDGQMPLTADDFVAIRTGYGRKSEQVKVLAAELNLGAEAVVFVDDNPVELAEMAAALPQVTRLAFPKGEEGLPDFIDRLAGLFDRPAVTAEDRDRTALYRRRLATLPPAQADDLHRFLRDLDMRLTIRDCSSGDRQRPLQLINKTNQFSINGRRITEDELSAALDRGGRLYSARLDDRSGSHGEILACLLDADGRIQALAMSCRVLERRVEYAFIAWLAGHVSRPLCFATQATERNEPARRFLDHPAISGESLLPRLDGEAFRAQHADDLALFTLTVC